jgi:N6-adenosine-specific RNA methylase IME4
MSDDAPIGPSERSALLHVITKRNEVEVGGGTAKIPRLVRYEAARRALAKAHRVDEVKDIRDRWVAVQAYARQAKDTELIEQATEIKLRAERRAGELLLEIKKNKGAAAGGEKEGPRGRFTLPRDETPKLSDLGVTKTQSSRWQKLADLDEPAFEVRVAEMKRRATSLSALNKADIRERRAEREADLGAKQIALPNSCYGVIYADCPWRWEAWSRVTGLDWAAESHYATMSLDEIKALDIASIAAKDSVLFLWATQPALDQALDVMRAWGFTYKTHFVWAKDRIGTGYWNRNQHELMLVGTKGNIPAPAPGTQLSSLIAAAVGRHSEKPEIFYRLIEAYFPNLPKIELFARARRPGWHAWGNEAPKGSYFTPKTWEELAVVLTGSSRAAA